MAQLCREMRALPSNPARSWGEMMKVILAVFALVLACGSVAVAQDADARRIVVTGQGATRLPHDSAVLRLGVESDAATAAAALDTLGSQMQAVIDALVAEGLSLDAVETSQLSLYQRNDSGGLGSLPGPSTYVASSILTVRTQRIDAIGAVLDATVDSGANRIDGLSFEVADVAAALDEARRLAVADRFLGIWRGCRCRWCPVRGICRSQSRWCLPSTDRVGPHEVSGPTC